MHASHRMYSIESGNTRVCSPYEKKLCYSTTVRRSRSTQRPCAKDDETILHTSVAGPGVRVRLACGPGKRWDLQAMREPYQYQWLVPVASEPSSAEARVLLAQLPRLIGTGMQAQGSRVAAARARGRRAYVRAIL